MNKRKLPPALILTLIFAVATASVSAAAPKALSATFSKNATPCGLWWFTNKWRPVWIEGEGRLIPNENGGYVMRCDFKVNFNDPHLLSREAFCSSPDFEFMCQGDGALVDNRTTCNIGDAEVHNGTVVAGPNGEGMFVCHVK